MNTSFPEESFQPRDRRLLRDWLRRLPPKWLFRLLSKIGFKPPPMQALVDASSFMLPQWMYVAARLQLAERLAIDVLSTAELAESTEVKPDRLGRLLYALEQQGYFRRCRGVPSNGWDGPWENTSKSATLMASHPNTIRPILLHWIEDCYAPTGRLFESLKEDRCAFSLENGPEYQTFFGEFLPRNLDRAQQFSAAMSATSSYTDQAVLEDFGRVQSTHRCRRL